MEVYISMAISIFSCLINLYIIANIIGIKEKYSMHYAFIAAHLSVFLWNVGVIVNFILLENGIKDLFFIQFIGNNFAAPFFLLTAYFFSKTEKSFKSVHFLLFVIPIVTLLFAVTNNFHHLFAQSFSIYLSDSNPGPIGKISILYSYVCMLIALVFLVYYSISNSGLFSKQAGLFFLSALIPLLVQGGAIIFKVHVMWFMAPIVFSFSMLIIWLAIVRHDFLSVIPVSLHHVVSHISEGLLILTKNNLLNETNNVFDQMFKGMINLKRKQYALNQIANLGIAEEKLIEMINTSINNDTTVTSEIEIDIKGAEKYFSVEITALFSKKKHIATMILIKDITSLKAYINMLENVNCELQAQNDEIAELNIKLQELAETDGLTGAYNRRFFNQYYEIEIARALNFKEYTSKNTQMDFGIAILDIDNFKKVNDTYGHIAGDSVLKQVVDIIKEASFTRDIVCRYGGEEFAIIFTKTDKNKSLQAAEKIRKLIEEHEFIFSDDIKNGHLTVSIGLAGFEPDYRNNMNDVLSVADGRLYKAKKTGKNKVVYE